MEDKRSPWKRFTEQIRTLRPIEPGSYKARSLSIEAQRDNAFNWLDKQSDTLRTREMVKLEKNLPEHLLRDTEFAVRFATKHEENPKRTESVIPLETRTSSEYLAKTLPENESFRRLLDFEATTIGLEPTEKSQPVSDKDKLFAIEHAKSLNQDEALEFLIKNHGDRYENLTSLNYNYDKEQLKSDLLLLDQNLLQNKDFLVKLDIAGMDLDILPNYVKQNDSLMKDCVAKSPYFFEVASKAVRNDQATFDSAIRSTVFYGYEPTPKTGSFAKIYECASEELRRKPENYMKAIEATDNHIDIFLATPEAFKNDKQVVEEALKRNPSVLKLASRELRKDRAFIVDMTDKYTVNVENTKPTTDKEILFNLAKNYSVDLDTLPLDMRNDPECVKRIVKNSPIQLQHAEQKMIDDPDVVLEAVSVDGRAIKYASDRLRNDFYIARTAVNESGLAHDYLGSDLVNNAVLAIEAFDKTPYRAEYFSEELKNNVELFGHIANTNPHYMKHAGESLKETIVKHMSEENRSIYQAIKDDEFIEYDDGSYTYSEEAKAKLLAESFDASIIAAERELLSLALPSKQSPEVVAEISQNLDHMQPGAIEQISPAKDMPDSLSTSGEINTWFATAPSPKEQAVSQLYTKQREQQATEAMFAPKVANAAPSAKPKNKHKI